MSAFDAYVQAAFHGGVMAGGPCFTVIHDAETPLRAGYADSITEFFRVGPTAGTSAHAMVDPVKANKLLPDNVVAWAAGPKANPKGWHLEQAGYARFTRADWTTADGMAQMRRAGACLREVHDTWSIPKRWCTDEQLRRAAAGDRASGGMTTHQQVSRVLGGTTHTDPETNYPRDLLLEIVLDDVEDAMANVPQNEWNQVRDQILTPRPSRVIGADGKPVAYSGPPLEYTAAAEGAAHAALRSSELARQEIAGLRAAVDKLATAVAAGDTVNAEELRGVISEEMAKVVQVEVSIVDRPEPATGSVS